MKNITDFDPKPSKYPYPIDTSEHYLVIKNEKDIKIDKDYPFIDKSKKFRFQNKIVRILLFLVGYLIVTIRTGLKIKGKSNLKQNKEIIKNGVISISNHIHMMDYMAILKAIYPIKPHTLVWDKNVMGSNRWFVRHVGGIPIPATIKANINMNKAINEYLYEGGWLHIYAEGSMWEFYRPIRPFKIGAAKIAIKNNKPIIPMAFSYRNPNFIRKYIFRQIATLTLNIGTPIYANLELANKEQEIDLIKRAHKAVEELANIKNNIYDEIYNDSKRIDYYNNGE